MFFFNRILFSVSISLLFTLGCADKAPPAAPVKWQAAAPASEVDLSQYVEKDRNAQGFVCGKYLEYIISEAKIVNYDLFDNQYGCRAPGSNLEVFETGSSIMTQMDVKEHLEHYNWNSAGVEDLVEYVKAHPNEPNAKTLVGTMCYHGIGDANDRKDVVCPSVSYYEKKWHLSFIHLKMMAAGRQYWKPGTRFLAVH